MFNAIVDKGGYALDDVRNGQRRDDLDDLVEDASGLLSASASSL